jgi:flagellar biosynthesis/type III secretory pathway protein FliH
MTGARARIIRAASAREARQPALSLAPSPAQWRRIAREELEAKLTAERIVEEARAQAQTMVIRAREEAARTAGQADREAREQAEARLAAQWLVLERTEKERLQGDAQRVISVAVVLAERLLGAALELEPARVVDLARAAIAEARGARHIVVEAHPLDAGALRRHLQGAGLEMQSVEVCQNETLARGELRLQTDVGTIDAKLAPRLERLAAALRDALP